MGTRDRLRGGISQRRYCLLTSAAHEAGHHVANWCRYRIDGSSVIHKIKPTSQYESSASGCYRARLIGPVASVAGMVAQAMLDPIRPINNPATLTAFAMHRLTDEWEASVERWSDDRNYFKSRKARKRWEYRKAKQSLPMLSASDLSDVDATPESIHDLIITALDLLDSNRNQLIWTRDKLLRSGVVLRGELPAYEIEAGLALNAMWVDVAGPAPWCRDEITSGRLIESSV